MVKKNERRNINYVLTQLSEAENLFQIHSQRYNYNIAICLYYWQTLFLDHLLQLLSQINRF